MCLFWIVRGNHSQSCSITGIIKLIQKKEAKEASDLEILLTVSPDENGYHLEINLEPLHSVREKSEGGMREVMGFRGA